MFPLRDENPSQSTPVITRVLIVLNAAAFVYQLMMGAGLGPFMYTWGMVPARITLAARYGEESLAGPGFTLLTSMFLHGGWLHLVGNMWYLWIFGDNVEDRLGRGRFLLFYLTAGVVAALIHYALHPVSRVPTVGASGAIAGVLGAYLVAFPRARVVTLVPLFPFFQVMALPAVLVLGLWFVMQFFSGFLALGYGGGGGVAWWAHIGGFAFGLIGMKPLANGGRRPGPGRGSGGRPAWRSPRRNALLRRLPMV
jgi:membrane associated rhomboid family serine protease